MQDFLNAVLRLPEGYRIVELDFIPQEEIPDLGQGKRSIFDIKCKDEAGKIYVIEMQNRRDKHFLKSMQFYASHTYSTQLKLAKSYADLVPVIVVAISKSNLFPQDIECISYHKTKEEKTGKQHLFELSYVFIELKKFTKAPEELKSVEDYWLYFLSSSESTKEPPSSIDDEMVLQAYKTVEQFNWSEAEYDAYIRARLLAETEELNLDDSYERGKKEVALKMLAKGKSIGEIAEFTELSVEEILKLKQENEKNAG